MNLEDKAKERPTVYLAGSLLESEYSYQTPELVDADTLTEQGEFPEYGDFLECRERSPVDGSDRGECYVEVPAALARWLVEHTEPGSWWKVNAADKNSDGAWQFDAEVVVDDGQSSLSAAAAMDDDDD